MPTPRRIALALAGLVSLTACAADGTKLETDKQKLSYVVGHQIGNKLKADQLDIDPASLAQAIKDVMAGEKPRLTDEDMQKVIMAYGQKRAEEQRAKGEQSEKAGAEFLAANGKKPGVVTTKSGLQYKVVKEAKGKKPKATDTVIANYKGTLINGTEFDSSAKHGGPATFPVNGVIRGWSEALQLMSEGAKWEVYVPAALAYGLQGAGPMIGPNETLVFEIELVKIK